jgi:hypothetical protein
MMAPEHDDMDADQLDDMDARPGYYKKTPIIRHPDHLNGMIYHFYVKPNREVVCGNSTFLMVMVVHKDIK